MTESKPPMTLIDTRHLEKLLSLMRENDVTSMTINGLTIERGPIRPISAPEKKKIPKSQLDELLAFNEESFAQ